MARMTIEAERAFWPTRIAMLARLARADALAVVLRPQGDPFVTYAAHNMAAGTAWTAGGPAALLVAAFDGLETADTPVSIPLADGRVANAMRAVPVDWTERRIGALAALRVGAPFSPSEVADLRRLAELVALELVEENTFWRMQSAATDIGERTRAASDLREVVRAERDPDALLARATSGLAQLFDADGVSIMLADEDVLTVRSAVGLSDDARRDRKRIGEGISGFVAKTGEPLLLRGPIGAEQPFRGNDPSITGAMIAPLRSGEHTIGVVNVKRHGSSERFDPTDLAALTAIGGDIAATLSFVNVLRRAEEDRKQAIALFELSRLGAQGSDPQAELDTAVAMLADLMRHDVVGLWLLDDQGNALRRAARGCDGAPRELASDAIDPTLASVLSGDRVVPAHSAADDPGRPAWAAGAATEYVLVPVTARGAAIGALVLGRAGAPYPVAEMEFAATAAEYVAELARQPLDDTVQERATAGERKRIAQELHDGLAQELTGVVLGLEGAQRAFERDPRVLGPQLAKATRDARATLADVRQYMGALRQSTSASLGLPTTVARLIDDLRRQSGLSVDMQENGDERDLAPDVERAVVRIVGEALRNVAQHANAKGGTVTLSYRTDSVEVTIADDGIGFDAAAMTEDAAANGHFGLVGMRERAEAVGGALRVDSSTGGGAVITASIPYQAAQAPAGRGAGGPDRAERAPARFAILARLFGR
jgi:signal transduction histidine kinase